MGSEKGQEHTRNVSEVPGYRVENLNAECGAREGEAVRFSY